MKWRFVMRLLAMSLFQLPLLVRAQSDEPEFIRAQFVGGNFVLAFSPPLNQWSRIEFSDDLVHWRELVSTISTRNPATFVDDTVSDSTRRYYRLVHPSRSVEDAFELWEANHPPDYTFRLLHVDSSIGTTRVLTGTVTVSPGAKLVSEVTVNDEPSLDFTEADFPSIDELFSLLRDIQNRAQDDFVWVEGRGSGRLKSR